MIELIESSLESAKVNKPRRNSICSEYYCWYGHEDCFSEGGRGHKPRGNKLRRNGHPKGRGLRPDEGSRNCGVFEGNLDGDSAGLAQQYPGQEPGFGCQQGQGQHCSQTFERPGSQARIDDHTFYDSFFAGWHFMTNNGLGGIAHNNMEITMNEENDGLDKLKRERLSIEETKKQQYKRKIEETSSAQLYPEWEVGVEYQQGLSQHCSQNFKESGSQAKIDDQSFYDAFSAGWNFRTNDELVGSDSNSSNNIGYIKQMKINMNEKVRGKSCLDKPKRAKLSIEEIKKQHSKKKTEGGQELANHIDEKSEIADKAAKIKEALESLPGSLKSSHPHHGQECLQPQCPEPDNAHAVPTRVKIEKLMVPDGQTTSDYTEIGEGKGLVEATDDLAEESLISSQPSILPAFHEDQVIPPPPATTVVSEYDPKPRLADIGVRTKVPETSPTCKDIAGIEATSCLSSSLPAASGPTNPLDSATRFAPVYKNRRRARMIGGYELVIGTIGDLVDVKENKRNEAEKENHVEINLETSPDVGIEQDSSNKLKSFEIIFKEESRLLSDLQSVDAKMTNLVQERSNVVKQLLFLSELKSQMLK